MNKKTAYLRVEDVRRRNLQKLKNESQLEWKELGKEIGLSGSYLSQVMSGHRAFSEKAARKIELKLKLPTRALDSENQGTVGNQRHITDKALLSRVKDVVDGVLSATGRSNVSEDRYERIIEFIYFESKVRNEVDAKRVGRLVGEILQE